ncbi:hypothetical protein ACIF6L_26515 [Kitasatospora sp. NPDC086009]|uniref:hypothetical protein n=1 Tax=unclassified Kitasatospora TaxID=2633591 RepID=UPI0037CC2834
MIKSIGGKSFHVYIHGADVALDWTDPHGDDGDALLAPDDARRLARVLRGAAELAEECGAGD